MNPRAHVTYRVQVDLLGRTLLRLERRRTELGWLVRPPRAKGPFGPPLRVSAQLKELLSQHYLAGRHVAGTRPVAWVTSGAPVEFLRAIGYFVHYPENHGAVCGVRKIAPELAAEAEAAGYSRDICSYARTDFGSLFSGRTPVGRLPRPDLLLCCTNICQTVLSWYRVLAHHLHVPLVVIDTPFLYDEARPHDLAYVRRQLEDAIPVAERVAGRSLRARDLEGVLQRSKEATELWLAVLRRCRHVPSPMSAFDQFIHMGPIVEMRDEPATAAYYRALLAELDHRAARGIGAVTGERRRLLWDNLPIWFRIRDLSRRLAERGVAVVASTYTNAWGELAELIRPGDGLDAVARVYLHPILNRGTGHKLRTMVRMVDEYGIDGVILHSDRSCKPYSIGQMDQTERLYREHDVPALLLEADHNDSRVYSEEQTVNRLEAFLEGLGV